MLDHAKCRKARISFSFRGVDDHAPIFVARALRGVPIPNVILRPGWSARLPAGRSSGAVLGLPGTRVFRPLGNRRVQRAQFSVALDDLLPDLRVVAEFMHLNPWDIYATGLKDGGSRTAGKRRGWFSRAATTNSDETTFPRPAARPSGVRKRRRYLCLRPLVRAEYKSSTASITKRWIGINLRVLTTSRCSTPSGHLKMCELLATLHWRSTTAQGSMHLISPQLEHSCFVCKGCISRTPEGASA